MTVSSKKALERRANKKRKETTVKALEQGKTGKMFTMYISLTKVTRVSHCPLNREMTGNLK